MGVLKQTKEVENLKYELAKSLVLNFFYGHYYIVFDNDNDVEEFLNFINIYDKRYSVDFERKKEIRSVMWKYVKSLHKHHLEWQNYNTGFEKYEAERLEYKKIKLYIKEYLKVNNIMKSIT